MSWADLVNATFELSGSFFVALSVVATWRAKRTEGIDLRTVGFFASWGLWNLYYYPSLGQWWSFAGGVAVCAANFTWLALIVYYRRQPRVRYLKETP